MNNVQKRNMCINIKIPRHLIVSLGNVFFQAI
jgi:hypothetical protein